jgi:hypothetical protein
MMEGLGTSGWSPVFFMVSETAPLEGTKPWKDGTICFPGTPLRSRGSEAEQESKLGQSSVTSPWTLHCFPPG